MTESIVPPAPTPEQLRDYLFHAARSGEADMIAPLVRAGVDLEARDDRGYTPLVLASYNGRLDTTRALLSAGALPDGTGDHTGNSALMGVAFKGYVEIVRLLLDSGAATDRRNGAGQTALMMAALFGQDAVVDLLLARGADADAVDAQGNSARALAAGQGNAAMVDRLSRG